MTPKGSRGSLFTMPLMNTCPASSSSTRRSISFGSWVKAAEPRPNGVSLARASASPRPFARATAATGPKTSSSQTLVPLASRATVGSKKKPGRSRRRPPQATFAPCSRAPRTCFSRSSRTCREASGPTSVASSCGSPILSARIPWTKRFSNSGAILSCTMKRLAAMQLWPAFWTRAAMATLTALSGPARVGLDGLRSEVALGVLRIVAAAIGALLDLGDGGLAQLSHLQRHQAAESVLALLEQRRGAGEPLAALGEAGPSPPPSRGGGFLELLLDDCIGVGWERLDGFPGRGIHAGDGHGVPRVVSFRAMRTTSAKECATQVGAADRRRGSGWAP